eukprot:282091_1
MAAEEKKNDNNRIILDITSDFACPWCYVGYYRFNNAIRAVQIKKKIDIFSNPKIEINWHPYMIDLQTNKNGEPFLDYNRRRWGSDGWFTNGCKVDAQKDGAKFAGFGRENPKSYWANTLNAHRFMWFFSKQNKINKNGMTGLDILESSFNLTQHKLKGIILKYYYEKGVNISLKEHLIKLAQELGMNDLKKTQNIDFCRWLQDEQQGKIQVMTEDKNAKKRGISGVPYFVITMVNNGKSKVFWQGSGARDSKWWVQVLDQLIGD